MLQVIKSDKRHFEDYGWLKTFWLFSFSNYYEKENIHFGPLRVFNDDYIMPGEGFPTHPHAEMEIITIVLEGEITHKDSMNNATAIKAGEVQRISAGTGITHSEYNLSGEPLHLYQIWIIPDEEGVTPSYEEKEFDPENWRNKLFPIVSGRSSENGTLKIHSDSTIFRGSLEKDSEVIHKTDKNRKVFVYVTSGVLVLNGIETCRTDQARIESETDIRITAREESEFILIDLPE
ncbi:pirin family protein [candidate division KSB1 bacterium]